jgi:hypothetical protein
MKVGTTKSRFKKQLGVSMVEFAIISPIVMLLGLGAVQVGMLMYSKSSLNYALQEAVRRGANSNGDLDEIESGLAAGLVPFRGGGSDAAELLTNRAKMKLEVALGRAQKWIVIKQLSPSKNSFTDWAEDAVDESGNAVKEIPNANLAYLRCTKTPVGGATAYKASTACSGSGEKIGSTSQQTLADANVLKIQMTYGVKVAVPFVGAIVGRALSMIAGCQTASKIQAGPLDLGTPTVDANAEDCFFYNAVDINGRPEPRLPVRIEATARMQTPLRLAVNGSSSIIGSRVKSANTTGPAIGNGTVGTPVALVPVSTLNPNGVKFADDQQVGTGKYAMKIGTDDDCFFGRLGKSVGTSDPAQPN